MLLGAVMLVALLAALRVKGIMHVRAHAVDRGVGVDRPEGEWACTTRVTA
jgi:hypothetical protein